MSAAGGLNSMEGSMGKGTTHGSGRLMQLQENSGRSADVREQERRGDHMATMS